MGVGETAAAADGKRKLEPGGGGGGGGKRLKADGEPDWARLADDALFCIFRAVLLSGHATASFAAVCRPWRALAASSKKHLAPAAPPLLLQPTWGESAMCPAGPRSARRAWRPGPTRPSLRASSPAAATPQPPPPPPTALPERFLRTRAVCQSRGYLVAVDESTGRPALTNPLTGEDLVLFPPLLKQFGDYASFGMIAAVLGDPSSSSGPGGCRMVLYCEDRIFRTCVSGAAAWDTTPWEEPEDPPVQLAVARGRVYALLSRGDLLVFDFMLSFHYCRINLKEAAPEIFRLESRLSPSMVEHGGQLFVVHCLFLPSESMPRGIRFSVHRLVRRQWVKLSSLDGLALFVDMAGSALLRARPSQWGGKENHVYVSGQLWDGWKAFPFGDLIKPDQIPVENTIEADWPTPLWTLPCSCY